jgi:hypothetical protein
MTEEVINRGRSILRKLRGSNKALSGRQLQEVEAPGALEEDIVGLRGGYASAKQNFHPHNTKNYCGYRSWNYH